MSIETTHLPEDYTILVTIIPPPKFPDDVINLSQEVVSFKKAVGGHIYRILDFTKLPMTFSDLVMGMGSDRNTEGGINDPDVSTIFIGSGEWVEFGVKAFREQAQYGETNVKHVCISVDEALAFVRADRKEKTNDVEESSDLG
jgi:hypothetical protein